MAQNVTTAASTAIATYMCGPDNIESGVTLKMDSQTGKLLSDTTTHGANLCSETAIDATAIVEDVNYIGISLCAISGCSAVSDCAFDASFTFLGKGRCQACYGPTAMTNDIDKSACTDYNSTIISLGLSSVTISSEAQAALEGWVSERKLIESVA
jgi:hypothetical protein